ncbi:S100P-binding protein-like [Heptranchias perlo]|uniref:S100P-binding protein-like n=1 Tax=Heptranchias perlo TaxID=212740 RepID=UPI003559FE65
MKEIMDGDRLGVFCNLKLKIEDNMHINTSADCAVASELPNPQFSRELSPITRHVHTLFKRPRIDEQMCSSPCNKLSTKSIESPTSFRCFFQSNNLTEGVADTSVSAATGHFNSSVNFSTDMQFDLFNTLITIKRSTPLKEASPFYLRMKTTLNDIEDLDDSLLELEENEDDGEDPKNLTSEEIDMILRESDDDTVDNSVSAVLKFGVESRVDDKTLCECKYVSDSLLSLSPPNTSKWPQNYLVIDEIRTSYSGDVSSTDVTVLKVEREINQSLKSELQNLSSVSESNDVEKSDNKEDTDQSVDEFTLINHTPVCVDEAIDEINHAGSNNEVDSSDQDKMLTTTSTSCSPNLLKDNNKLTFWDMISERVVSFIDEKADVAEVKENINFPVQSEDKVKDLENASKSNQSVVETAKKEEPQKLNPAKRAAVNKETSQRTRLNCAFDAEVERKKHLYLQLVSNHIKDGYENQEPRQELLCLMDQVANREYRNHSRSWQHPSDLTSRNYSRRNMNSVNKPNLLQWANSNGHVCRFSGIPDRFQRSPIP